MGHTRHYPGSISFVGWLAIRPLGRRAGSGLAKPGPNLVGPTSCPVVDSEYCPSPSGAHRGGHHGDNCRHRRVSHDEVWLHHLVGLPVMHGYADQDHHGESSTGVAG